LNFKEGIKIFSVKLFIQEIYKYILYTNIDQNLETLDYMPGSGQAVTLLLLSPPKQAIPLTHE
jgi:hypothetical protein